MMRDGAKTGVVYNVFDCVSIDEWERKDSDSNLFDRYDMLKLLLPGNYTWVQIVPELYRGSDVTQVTYWFNYATQHGWEGVMLKLNAPYVRKRTDTMLKIKQMHEIDLVCIRVNQGEQDGKNANPLGSITVDYNGVEVNVGGGYSDYERNDYWTNPDKIVGKIVTVQYLAETVNERNQPSLQSPQFLGVRLDE
jgi:DNA ligase-1